MASLGLQAVGRQIYKDGKPFRHIGMNHFSLFQREFFDLGIPNPGLAVDVNAMAAAEFKVIRVGFGFYGYPQWRDYYYNNQTAYWAIADRVLDSIAAAGMVCIVNMAWSLMGFTQLTYLSAGATQGPAKLGDKTSSLYALFAAYATTFIRRYKNHPGVAAWEFGNESSGTMGNEMHPSWPVDGTGLSGGLAIPSGTNFGTKPEGGTYAVADKMTNAQFLRYTQYCRELCDSNDPWGRMVLSSETAGNSFAVKIRRFDSLAADSFSDWSGRPDTGGVPWVVYRDQSYHALCDHIYPLTTVPGDGRWFSDGKLTYAQQITNLKTWADFANKPAVLEEFGATSWGSATDPVSTDLASETALFNQAVGAVVSADIPLALVWNWGGNIGIAEWMKWDVTIPARAYQVNAIKAINAART